MTAIPPFQVFAIRYAHQERRAAENFIGGDPHDGPMPMDYFVWAAVRDGETVVIDTGFNRETAARRDRRLLRCPAEGLGLVGVDARTVRQVVITHMHYDHLGNLDRFPAATFHLQDREMAFATGRHMGHAPLRHAFEVEDVVSMVRNVYKGRVVFHNGAAELTAGLSVHHVGGHTDGLQVVRIWTRRGWLVLASDASHYYANMGETRPFPIVFHVGDMIEGYGLLTRLADGPDLIVPGHDPAVMERYPAPAPDLVGIAVQLDADPVAAARPSAAAPGAAS